MERNIELLKKLIETPSPSGDEGTIAKVFIDECLKGEGVRSEGIDRNFNAAVTKGTGNFRLMIGAHYDNIGLMIQCITEHGFLHVVPNGGSDKKIMPGQIVDIITQDNGIVTGIIGKAPIHVESPEQRKMVDSWDKILVNVGASSKDEVKEMGIAVGDSIVFHSGQSIYEFGPKKDKIMSKDLDDQAGIYIVAEVMKRVKVPDGITLWGLGFSDEERGLVGAGIASNAINPDLSIDIDVTPSTESEQGISKEKFGDVAINKGVVLTYGRGKSRRIGKVLKAICDEQNIPYQFEVSTAGGTNTTAIQGRSIDCETYLLSLPNLNMHTNVEICGWVDIEACINLLIAYIEDFKIPE